MLIRRLLLLAIIAVVLVPSIALGLQLRARPSLAQNDTPPLFRDFARVWCGCGVDRFSIVDDGLYFYAGESCIGFNIPEGVGGWYLSGNDNDVHRVTAGPTNCIREARFTVSQ